MAFPFQHGFGLRERILIAIGSSGLGFVLPGCTSSHPPGIAAGGGGRTSMPQAGKSAAASHADAGMPHQPSAGQGDQGTAGRAHAGEKVSAAGRGTAGAATSAGAAAAGKGALVAGSGAGASAGAAGSSLAMCQGGGLPSRRECFAPEHMQHLATFGCGMIPITPEPTAEEAKAKFLSNGCLSRQATCDGCCVPAAGEGEPQADGSCCYMFCTGACCGRPLLVEGEARVAALRASNDWLAAKPLQHADAFMQRIAAEWRQDALMEHASIASFARFTLELLAFGAPAELIELAQRAGLDEIEHARACFSLAASYDGAVLGAAELTLAGVQPASSLWDAALSAFREGCIGETIAALHASEALQHARDPEVIAALTRIAADEARHAELAWRFVAWALQRLGAQLAADLHRQLGVFAISARSNQRDSEHADARAALHRAGRLTPSEAERCAEFALREVVTPCLRALRDQAMPSSEQCSTDAVA